MSNADAAQLHLLFLTGLAVAGLGCSSGAAPLTVPPDHEGPDSGTGSTPPTSATSASATASSPEAGPVDAARAYALEFHSVGSLANAFPNVEHLGRVNTNGMATFICEPAPCSKEWTKLGEQARGSGAVVRRNGVLEYVLIAGFKDALGVVDTPEKAAARLEYYDDAPLGTCGHFRSLGLACAAGSDDSGFAVRRVPGGFEVATYGGRNVCSGSFGHAIALGVMKISFDGDIQTAHQNVIVKLANEKAFEAAQPPLKCVSPQRGRMFEGFVDLPCERSELAYYVRAQRQEAAAVVAFERLAIELEAHGAPFELIEAARRSADDERRHTALFQREASRLFAELALPAELPGPNVPDSFVIRPLPEILRENIVEGCANETYAALVATHQAERAPTPRLRAMFASIASDERNHAALAHRLHAWGLGAVAPAVADSLRSEQRVAYERLRTSMDVTPIGRALGEPEPTLTLIAFDQVSQALSTQAGDTLT